MCVSLFVMMLLHVIDYHLIVTRHYLALCHYWYSATCTNLAIDRYLKTLFNIVEDKKLLNFDVCVV